MKYIIFSVQRGVVCKLSPGFTSSIVLGCILKANTRDARKGFDGFIYKSKALKSAFRMMQSIAGLKNCHAT